MERAGLRDAMKIMNQKYLDAMDEEEAPVSSSLNDTDSEKRKNLNNDNVETEVAGSKESAAMRSGPRFDSQIFSLSLKYFLVHKIFTGTDS